jgi:hypothetical protein
MAFFEKLCSPKPFKKSPVLKFSISLLARQISYPSEWHSGLNLSNPKPSHCASLALDALTGDGKFFENPCGAKVLKKYLF